MTSRFMHGAGLVAGLDGASPGRGDKGLEPSTADRMRQRYPDRTNSDDWRGCRDLEQLYASMRAIGARGDFSAIDSLFSDDAPSSPEVLLEEPVGIIVETRRHPHLALVVTNFIEETGLKVQLFHGADNAEYIYSTALQTYIEQGKLVLYPLAADALDASRYNALFLSKAFWHRIIGRGRVFVFQTDSWICKGSGFSLSDFIGFDYIGAAWPRKRPVGLIIDGGCGGLSIRNWKKTIEVLDIFPSHQWKGGEDGFFAFHIELLGGKVARNDDCAKFCTQHVYAYQSYGAHQIKLLPDSQRVQFLRYCPEAAFLLDEIR